MHFQRVPFASTNSDVTSDAPTAGHPRDLPTFGMKLVGEVAMAGFASFAYGAYDLPVPSGEVHGNLHHADEKHRAAHKVPQPRKEVLENRKNGGRRKPRNGSESTPTDRRRLDESNGVLHKHRALKKVLRVYEIKSR